MGTADAFTHGKEQHFLATSARPERFVPQLSHIPQGCAQPAQSGLEKPKRTPPQLGFKEKRKSKYQR